MGPCKLFWWRLRLWSFSSLPKLVGIVPFNSLFWRLNVIKPCKLPISSGMLPLSWQSYAKNCSRDEEKFPTNGGRMPPNGLSAKTTRFISLQFVKEERKLQSSSVDDDVPGMVKLFPIMVNLARCLNFPNVFGMWPEK